MNLGDELRKIYQNSDKVKAESAENQRRAADQEMQMQLIKKDIISFVNRAHLIEPILKEAAKRGMNSIVLENHILKLFTDIDEDRLEILVKNGLSERLEIFFRGKGVNIIGGQEFLGYGGSDGGTEHYSKHRIKFYW